MRWIEPLEFLAGIGHGEAPVDTFQYHRSPGGREGHRAGDGPRPDEPAPLQPLGGQAEPKAVLPKQVDAVTPSPAKGEDMGGRGIGLELGLNQGGQAIETAAHR